MAGVCFCFVWFREGGRDNNVSAEHPSPPGLKLFRYGGETITTYLQYPHWKHRESRNAIWKDNHKQFKNTVILEVKDFVMWRLLICYLLRVA